MAVFAGILIAIFDADLTRLIQLYLVGVFVSFTLSQSGMVVHWLRLREPGWRTRMYINGFGAAITGIVFCVVVTTKFAHGAYIVVIATPLLILLMRSINRHYTDVLTSLRTPNADRSIGAPGISHS